MRRSLNGQDLPVSSGANYDLHHHQLSTGAQLFVLKPRWDTPCYEKLGRLPWAGGFSVRSHGVTIGIRVNDADLIAPLRAASRFMPEKSERSQCAWVWWSTQLSHPGRAGSPSGSLRGKAC